MRWKSTLSTAAVGLIAVLCIGFAGSCQIFGDLDGSNGEARKLGYGQLRTDQEPLVQRFPTLRAALDVQWMAGLYGRPSNPGPSTYWIDAVVTLDAGFAEELGRTYAPATTQGRPPVVFGMKEHLPPGPFQTGKALNAAFIHGTWSARVYLAPRSHRLVLIATGT